VRAEALDLEGAAALAVFCAPEIEGAE
jgi:hypothetical protein